MGNDRERILVVGAGAGGLAAAALLATQGLEVIVLERAAHVGGKMREIRVGEYLIDGGPTVLTMRWVFEELFTACGMRLDDHLRLRRAEVLARHAWPDGARLDLFAEMERTIEAIKSLSGPREADGYRRFCAHTQEIFRTVDGPFLKAERPTMRTLLSAAGSLGLGGIMRIDGYRSLWKALGDFFHDPRLLQLFGRYATYCGSSPFAAPATLNVIAHVEREGVWLVEGGMFRVAEAVAAAAVRKGATIRCGAHVAELDVRGGQVRGVRLADGEHLPAGAVIFNGDVGALARGMLGSTAAKKVPDSSEPRSLSAITWALSGTARGFPLLHHNVFFSSDYPREFHELFDQARLPEEPTVYVCAQDRGASLDDASAPPVTDGAEAGRERFLCLINAPATGDKRPLSPQEIRECETRTFNHLRRLGLSLERSNGSITTTPSDFDRLFPGTGGALYGPASHGWSSPLARAGSRTKIRSLYLAGGGVHPGAGVPMATLSGRLAATSVLEDLGLTSRSLATAMPGGTWMS
ncbi:1-hydroxycarotenoid 3,4-desaturase CrtD [Chondromyces apiculatus]|uniref:Methoxyneurosporene dehydrogenase n=1 Tax=Chondromyces apiculatus DSM 436 TaxID=1192034 RepID=A0A017T4P8_9BACT|nr:1-hydroxycarotenoid 3,4-desaturase CrtD [Chondromyces apiculatus]EYF03790.1 Methoxyneurosporene dehydrogenase [Chondromyces apiculatus DSM 436]